MFIRFDRKPPIAITEGRSESSNWASVELKDVCYILSKSDHVRNSKKVCEDNIGEQEFISQSTPATFIASVYRLNLSFGFASALQVLTPHSISVKALNFSIQKANGN